MNDSYVWQMRQQGARQQYGWARYALLKPVLMAARTGALNPDWRDFLSTGLFGEAASDDAYNDSNNIAFYELSTMAVQSWEPYAGLGWRAALDGWYEALVEVNETRGRTDRPIPGSDVDTPEVVIQLHERFARNPVLASFAERAAEGRRRWRDQEYAWYYAGLAAGGVNIDWRAWYRSRIATWTTGLTVLEGPSAIAELTDLEDGKKDHLQSLPAYWT